MRTFFSSLILSSVLFFALGCQQSTDENVEVPDWLSSESEQNSGLSTPETGTPRIPDTMVSVAPALNKASLTLKLKPGDRMPLVKTVETNLEQASLSGQPEIHRSRLQLSLVLSVEEQAADRTKLGVRYSRVQLSRNLGGEQIGFDTSVPGQTRNPEFAAYRAMIGDGFSYWIGSDNRVLGVDGFQGFMNRCLSVIPEQNRKQVLIGIEQTSGERGLADFVDQTIGLLPYNSTKAVGESWTREHIATRPFPVRTNQRLTLQELNPEIATIHIEGDIDASTSLGQATQAGVRVVVTGGKVHGDCDIFLASGLPKKSRLVEQLDMVVQMSGGVQFKQSKVTTTTIEAFPQQTASAINLTSGTSEPRF